MPVARGIRLAFGLASGLASLASGLASGLACFVVGLVTSVMLNSIGSIYRTNLFLTVFNSASKAYIAGPKLALG